MREIECDSHSYYFLIFLSVKDGRPTFFKDNEWIVYFNPDMIHHEKENMFDT